MINPDPHPAVLPIDRLTAVREWLWRHSSQPNGDPWDGDPEHLEWTARDLLNNLVQSFLGTPQPTSGSGRTYGPAPTTFAHRGTELLSSPRTGR